MEEEAGNYEDSGCESSSLSSPATWIDENIEETGQCRICHGESEVENLLSPCLCKGTAAYVHQVCLDEWVSRSKKKKCEMCLGKYESLFRGFKRLSQWTLPKPTSDRWEDVADFLCTVVWTFMLIQGVFFCGTSKTGALNDYLVQALKSTRLIVFWWLSFFVNCVYYFDSISKIYQRWIDANSIYEWKTGVRN